MNSQESVREFTDNDIVKILASKLEVVMELLCSKEDKESFDALNEIISDAFMAFFNTLITEIAFLPLQPVRFFFNQISKTDSLYYTCIFSKLVLMPRLGSKLQKCTRIINYGFQNRHV